MASFYFHHSLSEHALAAAMEEVPSSSSMLKRNWSEFPNDLLDIVMDKLSSPEFLSDYIHFGVVCVSWNSAFYDHDPPPHQFPPMLLTVPPHQLNKKKKRLRIFYNISDENNIDGRLEVRMPHYRHCRGSSHGWLITVDEDSKFAVRLFNPFLSTNGIEILLPSLRTFRVNSEYDLQNYSFLDRAVLSANPLTNPTDYTVMAIYGPSLRLAFFKPGNKRWTRIKSPRIENSRPGHFSDIICCHGKFFAVHNDGAVVVLNDKDHGKRMIAKVVLQPPTSEKKYTKKYLIVESSGRELLQVHRLMDMSIEPADDGSKIYSTIGFRVFKLKIAGGGAKKEEEYYEWQEVKSLCGDSMFLGQNTSVSVRASDYHGCKPNSIYYTDDSDACVSLPQQVSNDMGIFNLGDGSFKRHLPIAPKNTSGSIWIQPSLPNKKIKRSSC